MGKFEFEEIQSRKLVYAVLVYGAAHLQAFGYFGVS